MLELDTEIRLPKAKKTKAADLAGATLLADRLKSNSIPSAVANRVIDVLVKQTKVLARTSTDGRRENAIPVSLLVGLAKHHDKWVREPENYRRRSHNPYQQINGLIAHLFEKYPTAPFLQRGLSQEPGICFEETYFHIARGGNIRNAPRFPFKLTKTQAHLFHTTPVDIPIVQAAIRAQALSFGIPKRIVPHLANNNHVQSTEHNAFWRNFFEFLGRQNMVDPEQIGPLCDYLAEHRVTINRNNEPSEFNFKGRTINGLLERMEAWHRNLQRARVSKNRIWEPAVGIKAKENDNWLIREILREKELHAEGRELNHCVYSYARRCAERETSIWTLREKDPAFVGEEGRRSATIEVSLTGARRETICQAKRKNNLQLTAPQRHFLTLWAAENGLKISTYL